MKHRVGIVAGCGVLVLAAFSSSANGQTIYDNGAQDNVNGYGISLGTAEADNFSFSRNYSVTGAKFYIYSTTVTSSSNLDYYLFNGNQPVQSNLIVKGRANISAVDFIDKSSNYNRSLVTFSFKDAFQAESGTNYWLGLYFPNETKSVFWSTTNPNATETSYMTANDFSTVSKFNSPRQLAFSLQGVAPEPSTWLLMILGFGVVGYSMRRRKVSFGSTPVANLLGTR